MSFDRCELLGLLTVPTCSACFVTQFFTFRFTRIKIDDNEHIIRVKPDVGRIYIIVTIAVPVKMCYPASNTLDT